MPDLLAIQAKTVLSDHIFFNPFGVRFGVRSANQPTGMNIAFPRAHSATGSTKPTRFQI